MSVWTGRTITPQLWVTVLSWKPLVVDVRLIRWAFVLTFTKNGERN